MGAKNKIFTILALLLILIVLTGFGAFKPKTGGTKSDVSGKSFLKLGGIESRMPENSAQVFFTSTLGKKLSSYHAYKNIDECLLALRSGEVDAIWACDVTAQYLQKVHEDLGTLDYQEMADIEKQKDARFSFGMALKDSETGQDLKDRINTALASLSEEGILQDIITRFIDNAQSLGNAADTDKYYPSEMKSKSGNGVIKVGITGAVSPIELIDNDGEPYGFCVALMDEIGTRLGKRIKFVVLDNETAFTSLMSGRVDVIFTYGTGRKTTETKQNYIMTDGYYDMQRYDFLILKADS